VLVSYIMAITISHGLVLSNQYYPIVVLENWGWFSSGFDFVGHANSFVDWLIDLSLLICEKDSLERARGYKSL